jgi:Amt family ammonium transporter
MTSMGMVFLMQAGFAMVESGSVRRKNSSSVLVKNMYHVIISVICYWLVGYGLSFGEPNIYAGGKKEYFASSGFEDLPANNYLGWIFHFTYAITCAVIAQGALGERTKLVAYIILSAFIVTIVYPIIVAWTWGNGWLGKRGFHDYAGSGIVFMIGGCAAFWGSLIVGPRIGKTPVVCNHSDNVPENNEPIHTEEQRAEAEELRLLKGLIKTQEDEFRPNNHGLIVLGTFVLFFGWLFFNGGKTGMFNARANDPAKIIQNTFISAAFSGVVACLLKSWMMRSCCWFRCNHDCQLFCCYDARTVCNGVLTGLVAISGACDRCEPWAAVIIGCFAGIFYVIGCKVLQKTNIDDPVEASPVFLWGGVWGLLAIAFLDNIQGIVYPSHMETGRGKFFGYQICGIVTILLWTSGLFAPFFFIMKKVGLLRVSRVVEMVGMDVASNGHCMTKDEFEKIRSDLNWNTIKSNQVDDICRQLDQHTQKCENRANHV